MEIQMKFTKTIMITALAAVFVSSSAFAICRNGGFYRIKPKSNTNLNLNVTGASLNNGAQIQLYTADDRTDNLFKVIKRSSGYWTIKNVKSGKVLAVEYAKTTDGANVVQWSEGSGTNDDWSITADGSYFEVKARHSGKCLEVPSNDCSLYKKMRQWPDNNSDAQRWDFFARNVAYVYSDPNYGGVEVGLMEGSYTMSQLDDLGMPNDKISSHKSNAGYTITLFQNDNFSGTSWGPSESDVASYDGTWNDKVTSIIVKKAVASAPGYSGYTMWSNLTFDNGWDGSKWTSGCGTFGENATRFKPANTYVSGGLLHLRIQKEYTATAAGCENGNQPRSYTGAEFRMINAAITYGIAECRMKSPGNGGYISSMFTYDYGAATNRTDGWNEIDFEWEGSHQDKISTNLLEGNCGHSWECTQWCYCACSQILSPFSGFRHTDWHDYRLEWTPSYIKWFCDGKNFRTIDGNTVYRNPNGEDVRYASATNGCSNGWRNGYIPGHSTRVMFNNWLATHGSVANALGGEWTDSQLPKEALYDWIRVYYRN
jgi:beta-glucanase (GH16 family)